MSRRLPTLVALSVLSLMVASSAWAVPAVGVTSGNALVRFDTASPTVVTSTTAITGLAGGDVIVGIDFRPATNALFALGSSGTLYSVDITTAAATTIATVAPAISGTAFGVDFNPTVDRLRITSDADQNLRVVPDTGVATVDVALQYAGTDVNAAANPNVTASGYTNSFAGATTTTLYGIDTTLNILVTQLPPNNGTLNTVGPLGVDPSAVTGFDIDGSGNVAYAALQVGAGTSIYTINLTTGAATLLGAVGGGTVVLNGFSVLPAALVGSAIPTMSPLMLALLAIVLLAVAAVALGKL